MRHYYKHMAMFVAVVDAGSFTAAARQLGRAKSALSKYVSELEQELGVVLLYRTTRRLTLSEAGALYYEGCARMVAEAQAADSAVHSFRAEPTGTLRVSSPVTFGTDHVVPAVGEFGAQYPNLCIEINLEDRYVNLVEEGIDLAIRAGTLQDSSLVARRLVMSCSVVCASPTYLARRGVPRKPADLEHHDWVHYTPNSRRLTFRRRGRVQTTTVKDRFRTNSGNAEAALLRGGYGLALTPLWAVRHDLEAGRLKVVLTEYELRETPVYAVYPEGKHLLPRVRLFVDFLAQRFARTQWLRLDPSWIARNRHSH